MPSSLIATKEKYCTCVRMVIGAIIVKHYLGLDDRGTTAMISENVYLQYFCSLSSFQVAKPFHASLFVDIRKRIGLDSSDEWNQSIIQVCDGLQPARKRVICSTTENRGQAATKQVVAKDSSDKNDESEVATNNKGTLKNRCQYC